MSNTISMTFWLFTKGQIGYLKDRGFEVIAITSPGGKLQKFREREDIEVYPILMTREITPLKDLKALYQIWKIFLKLKPKIVHGSTAKAGLLTMLAALLAGIPVRLFFMRGLRFTELNGWRKIIVKFTEQIMCWCAHQVLCTSPSVCKIAIEEGICNPNKIKVLHNGTGNGIDSNRFDPAKFSIADCSRMRRRIGLSENARVLLFVGRLVRDKGVIELSKAWRALSDKYPDLHLVMAGKIEKEDPIPGEIISNLEGDERAHLLGHVDDVAPLYAIADILVLPTYREGIPIASLEASAMELPVVATKVVGCVDAVVDGVTGILVPPKDHKALADTIRSLLENPELRKKMGKAGRERAIRDFRPEDIWEGLNKEYVRLLRKKGIDPPRPS